jgi:NodT family efflux transporter outer membrane factor (OMF) lipoprotein
MKNRIAAGKRICTTAIAAFLASGCAVGPTYRQPDSAVASSFSGQSELSARKTLAPAPELDQWWLGFEDPTLVAIVNRALAENLDLAVAMARVDQARALAKASGAARLPKVSLDGQSLYQHQSLKSPEGEIASALPGYDRNQTLNTLGVGASWEADLAGSLRRSQEAAVDELQVAEAARTGVRISVAAEAADAYFRIRGAQRRIEVAEEQIHTQEDLLRLVQDRFAGGLGTNRETAQAQALLLEARTTTPPLRTELAQQLNRLDVLMAAQPNTYAKALTGDNSDYKVPAITSEISPTELLRRRPDVIAAERRLAASNARIGVAIAEYYPKVSLAGLLGFESLNGALFSSAAFQPQALLGLHWRLFDFGRVDAEVNQAKGVYAQALAEYRHAMLRATEEVENAIVTLTQLELQRADLEKEITAHRVARDAAQDAYEGGAVSLIEVLDEDRQLLSARDQLALLDANNARAAVATFRALGGGWESAPSRAANNNQETSQAQRPGVHTSQAAKDTVPQMQLARNASRR